MSTGVLFAGAAVGNDVNKMGAVGSVGTNEIGAWEMPDGACVGMGGKGDAVIPPIPLSGANVMLGRSGPGREGTGRVGSRTGGGVG